MDLLIVLQHFDGEVNLIPDVNNQVADALSRCPEFWQEHCNIMAQEFTTASR